MNDTTLARLSMLSQDDVAALVSHLWEQREWRTTVDGTIVEATRDHPFDQSLEFRVDDGLETTRYGLITGERVRAYGKKGTDADILVIVATEPFSRQAAADAERYGVKLIGRDDLATLVEEQNAVGYLTELAEGRSLYDLAEERLDITLGDTTVSLNDSISGTQNLVNFVQFLVRNGYLSAHDAPILVGRTRYLINTDPVHKNGSDMRRPKQVGDFWVETDFDLDAKRRHIKTLADATGLKATIAAP